jgi:plasmid stabilization system protein ParE
VIRITFADEAGQDIENIYDFIAEDSITAADRHRARLKRRCEQPTLAKAWILERLDNEAKEA